MWCKVKDFFVFPQKIRYFFITSTQNSAISDSFYLKKMQFYPYIWRCKVTWGAEAS